MNTVTCNVFDAVVSTLLRIEAGLCGTLCLSRRSPFPLACTMTMTRGDIFPTGHFSPCGDSAPPDDGTRS